MLEAEKQFRKVHRTLLTVGREGCYATSGNRLYAETRRSLLRAAVDSIYAKKGHPQKREPIEDRVLILWVGEDTFAPPRWGTTITRVAVSRGHRGPRA